MDLSTDLLTDIDTEIADSFSTTDEPEGDETEETTTEKDGGGKSEDVKPEGEKEEKPEEEETETETEEDKEKKPDQKPQKNRAQKRIEFLSRRNAELMKRLEAAEERTKSNEPEELKLPEPPKERNAYRNDQEYNQAVHDYIYEKGVYDTKAKQAEQIKAEKGKIQFQREADQILEKINKRKSQLSYFDKEEGRKIGFDEALDNIRDIEYSEQHKNAFHDVLYAVDNPAEVMFHLGRHPTLAESLVHVSSKVATAKLHEISVLLKRNATQKKVSGAPKPTGKVEGGGGGSSKNLDKASFEEVSKVLTDAEKKLNKKWL